MAPNYRAPESGTVHKGDGSQVLIPQLPPSVVRSINCHACAVAKSKKAPITAINQVTSNALKRVQMDLLEPMLLMSSGNKEYAIEIMDYFLAKYDFIILEEKPETYNKVMKYIEWSERVTGLNILNVWLNWSGRKPQSSHLKYQ